MLMPPLSSMLLQREVASLREVDEALARQALHGGDLVTNLLEVAHVDESALLSVLSEFHGLPAAPSGPLPPADPNAVALFPRDVAVEHCILPFRASASACDIIVTAPLSPTLLDDLRFALGVQLEQLVAVPARVRLALSRLYDVPADRRDLRVVARLEGLADPSPSEAPPPRPSGDSLLPPRFPGQPTPVVQPEGHDMPGPPSPAQPQPTPLAPSPGLTPPSASPRSPSVQSGFPRSATRATLPVGDPPDVSTRLSVPPALPSLSPERWSKRPRSVRLRRKGPFTPAMARDALADAESHGAILRILFDFSRQYFEYAALFLVRDDLAEGVDASGPGVDRDRIRGIGVPLDLPGILHDARERKVNVLAVPRSEGVDAALRQDLRRPMNREVLVIPVMIRQRVIALLYGDDGSYAVDMQEVGDLLAMVPLVSAALERLILLKKLGRVSSSPPSSAVSANRDTLRGLQGLPGLSGQPSTAPAIAPPDPLPTINAPFPGPFGQEESTRAGPPRPVTTSFAAPSGDRTGSAAQRKITASFGVVTATPASPPPPAEPDAKDVTTSRVAEPASGQSVPSAAPEPVADQHLPEPRDPSPPAQQAVEAEAPACAAEEPREPVSNDTSGAAPDVMVGEVEEPDDMVMAVLDELQRSPGPQHVAEGADRRESAVATHMIAEGPRMPPKSSHPSDMGLPLVMVDVRGVVGELMDTLEREDLPAEEASRIRDEIVRLGDEAAAVVATRFPGVTTTAVDPVHATLPPVGACGALLQVAAMLGRRMAKHVEPLLDAPDSNVRFWAVMFLAELGGSIASRAVLRGLFDDDERVRLGARAAMRAAAGRRAWVADVREKLRRVAEGAGEPLQRRLRAVESLGGLRERATVPGLIDLLEAAEPELRAAAHDALQAVARRRMPGTVEAWRAWWSSNMARDRVEWLLDALADQDDSIASEACSELEAMAGRSFGYSPGLSAEGRRVVVNAARAWWRHEGLPRMTEPPMGTRAE